MKQSILGCVACILVGSAWGQKAADMPTAAKQSLAKMEASVVQAKKKAVSELTAIASLETRAGRLGSAAAVNAQIKELNAEIEVDSDRSESKRGSDFIPGVWHLHTGGQYVLEKNNTFSASAGNFKWSGKWNVDNGKLTVDSTLFADIYDLPPHKEARDGKVFWVLKGKNGKGDSLVFSKEE